MDNKGGQISYEANQAKHIVGVNNSKGQAMAEQGHTRSFSSKLNLIRTSWG